MQAASFAIRAVRKPSRSLCYTTQGMLLDRNFHSTVFASATPISPAQPSVLRTLCVQLCTPKLTSGSAARQACSFSVSQTSQPGLLSRLSCFQAPLLGFHDRSLQRAAVRLCSSVPAASKHPGSQHRDVSVAAKSPKHAGTARRGGHSGGKFSQQNKVGSTSKPSKRKKKQSHKRKREQPHWRAALETLEDDAPRYFGRRLKHRTRSDESHEWAVVDRVRSISPNVTVLLSI